MLTVHVYMSGCQCIVSHPHSAQLYAVCSAATSGGLVLSAATKPRRMARPGRTIRYKVSVRPAATKQAKVKGTKAKVPSGSQSAAGPTLNLRVALPAGVRYMRSSTYPPLLTHDARGRKARRQPVQADGGLLTWENVGPMPKGRTFKVRVRVDSVIAPGTLLTFSAELFESVQVGENALPACPQSSPNVMVTVA